MLHKYTICLFQVLFVGSIGFFFLLPESFFIIHKAIFLVTSSPLGKITYLNSRRQMFYPQQWLKWNQPTRYLSLMTQTLEQFDRKELKVHTIKLNLVFA